MLNYLAPINFSGRTAYLKGWTGFANSSSGGKGVYIGELANDYITGLATTVSDELLLHNKYAANDTYFSIERYLKMLSFEKHYDKNPFKLSGGEQSMLTIICGLLYNPESLAIDTTAEQLSKNWRDSLFNLMLKDEFATLKIKLSDNRINENIAVKGNLLDPLPILKDGTDEFPIGEIHYEQSQLNWKPAADILIDNLFFAYERRNPVLRNCSFCFKAGNIYHLNGENGAGKSTLSKILCGLYKPDSGHLVQRGEKQNFYKYPGKVLGYSFQNPDDQLYNLTVRKEIKGSIKGENSDFIDKFKYFQNFFGLGDLLDFHPADLPFVIRKRISIATTLINEREWYVLDEPTIGQDDYTINEFSKLLASLADLGKGIIIISHSESFVRMFDNIIKVRLENGELNTI